MTSIKLQNHSLKEFNSLKLNALAALIYLPLNVEDFIETLKELKQKPILIGKGSNIFLKRDVYDETFPFIITHHLNHIEVLDSELIVEAGVSLHQLAWLSVDLSIDGYAFCEDIPGTVGGALIMNAGQYEYSIGQMINWVEVFHLKTQTVERLVPDQDFFSYRHANFKEDMIILRASLKKTKGKQEEILDEIYKYKKNRYAKQPREYANAGSVFKRPFKNGESLLVWNLFDACGLRGYRINDAQISEKHPGFIVNLNKAEAKDISALLDLCQSRVKDKFDIDLELEWKVIE